MSAPEEILIAYIKQRLPRRVELTEDVATFFQRIEDATPSTLHAVYDGLITVAIDLVSVLGERGYTPGIRTKQEADAERAQGINGDTFMLSEMLREIVGSMAVIRTLLR